MSNLQVKNVDEGLHEALRNRAAMSNATMSEYVLNLIRADLRKPLRTEWLRQASRLAPTGRSSDEIVDILHAGRGR